MEISIIVSAYNTHKYIEDCLESLLKMNDLSKFDWEILVGIDGCANTLAVLEKYIEMPNIKVYYQEQNQGCYPTTNFLITQTKYQNILIFNSDDVAYPTLLSSIAVHFNNYDVILFKGGQSTDMRKITKKAFGTGVSVVHKNSFNKWGYYKNIRCAADTFFLNLLKANKANIIYLDKMLFIRRVHSESLTHVAEYNLKSAYRAKARKGKLTESTIIPLNLLDKSTFKTHTTKECNVSIVSQETLAKPAQTDIKQEPQPQLQEPKKETPIEMNETKKVEQNHQDIPHVEQKQETSAKPTQEAQKPPVKPKARPQVKPKPKAKPQVNPKQETLAETTQETPAEPKQETPAEPKQETPAEPKQETLVEPKQETQKPPVKPKARPQVKPKPKAKPQVNPIQETPAEPKQETLVESKKETPAEPKQETLVESKKETPAEPKQEKPIPKPKPKAKPQEKAKPQAKAKQEAPAEPKKELPESNLPESNLPVEQLKKKALEPKSTPKSKPKQKPKPQVKPKTQLPVEKKPIETTENTESDKSVPEQTQESSTGILQWFKIY